MEFLFRIQLRRYTTTLLSQSVLALIDQPKASNVLQQRPITVLFPQSLFGISHLNHIFVIALRLLLSRTITQTA